jgi:uncharacterized protein (TIGR03086 family)
MRTPDLGPATGELARLVRGVADEQLTAPTPCAVYRLDDLLDHVGGLAHAFTAAARKDFGPWTDEVPNPDGARLAGDWRTRITAALDALAEAWRSPAAWEGMTRAGGLDVPGGIAGTIALNEVVIHSWDVARASGQEVSSDPETLDACLDFLVPMASPEQEAARQGMFGPVVQVGPDATTLDRAVGLSGRDPSWRGG